MDTIKSAMGDCLVGKFVDRFLSWLAIKAMANRWRVQYEIQAHKTLWLLFIFQNPEDYDRVLRGGPYVAYSSPLYLKPLSTGFLFQREELQHLPVWMQITNLPLECWTVWALSKLASMVGQPLYTDQLTRKQGRISFARVLVEVNITAESATTIPATLPDGTEMDLPIHFESHFKFCTGCQQMGHYQTECESDIIARRAT